jgi:hypothetical protein
LHIGQTHFTVNATFDDFSFPAVPADPQLLPSPAPSPTSQPTP